MLNVEKINTNNNFVSGYRMNSFANNKEAKKAYFEMNKDLYVDYVDGDISLATLLAGKFKNLWSILVKHDPKLELKAKFIEQNLIEQAQRDIRKNNFELVA